MVFPSYFHKHFGQLLGLRLWARMVLVLVVCVNDVVDADENVLNAANSTF